MTDDDFDHTLHRAEVEQRWGERAYADSDAWWRTLSAGERDDFRAQERHLARAWGEAFAAGVAPDSDDAQDLARMHEQWVSVGWGGRPVPPEALAGLGRMYVDDERFARHYGGVPTATLIRDALTIRAEAAM